MTGRIRADIVFRSFGDWGALLPETVSIPSVFDFENCDHQYGHHEDWPGQDRKHFAAPELTRPLNAPGFTVFQPFKIQPERYPTSYLGASRSCDLVHLAMGREIFGPLQCPELQERYYSDARDQYGCSYQRHQRPHDNSLSFTPHR